MVSRLTLFDANRYSLPVSEPRKALSKGQIDIISSYLPGQEATKSDDIKAAASFFRSILTNEGLTPISEFSVPLAVGDIIKWKTNGVVELIAPAADAFGSLAIRTNKASPSTFKSSAKELSTGSLKIDVQNAVEEIAWIYEFEKDARKAITYLHGTNVYVIQAFFRGDVSISFKPHGLADYGAPKSLEPGAIFGVRLKQPVGSK